MTSRRTIRPTIIGATLVALVAVWFSAQPVPTTRAQSWEPTGLAEPVTRLFAPSSGAFFAKAQGGLMRSDDGGASWFPVSLPESVPGASLGHVAVAPSNHQIVYLWAAGGVYRSVDDAATWSLALPIQGSSRAIAVSEADPNVVYVGLAGSSSISSDFWFFRSLDGGSSWDKTEEFHNSLCGWGVPILAPHGVDSQRVFRTADCYAGRNTSDELDQSLDAGATWIGLYDPRPQNLFPDHLAGGRGMNPDRLYLGTRRDARAGGGWSLQRSDDGGGSWGEVAGYRRQDGQEPPSGPDTRIVGLAMDPTAPDRVFMALANRAASDTLATMDGVVQVSNDGGVTWAGLGDGITARDLVLGVDGANLYAATQNGVLRLSLR